MRRTLALLFALVGSATAALATPNAHFWHREILLGANEKDHIYLLATMTNLGSYYTSTESLSICHRSNDDPRWMEKTTLRVTVRTVDPVDGSRKDTETFVAEFDFPQYLQDRRVRPAFFPGEPDSIAIDGRGMYYQRRGVRSYLLTAAELARWTKRVARGELASQKLRVIDLLEATTPPDSSIGGRMDFLVVRAGSGMDDLGQFEILVPVPSAKIHAAREEVRKKLAARPKPAAKSK